MKTHSGWRRWTTTLLAAFVAATYAAVIPGPAFALGEEDHWGVIARNTVGSPVAALRNGPYGSYDVPGREASPPYGVGSLGIEVASIPTSIPFIEKVDFGNEIDFYGHRVSELTAVGFHVFQTAENIDYGGVMNLPNIRFEIDPNLASDPSIVYSTLVWVPAASPTVGRWSPFLDATTTGTWFLTGAAGGATNCTSSNPCTFAQVMSELDMDGSDPATIYTAAVSKGADYMWIGAVDGLRINRNVYDFEPNGVRTVRSRSLN